MNRRGRKTAVWKFATTTSNLFRRHRRHAVRALLTACLAVMPAHAQLFIDEISRAEAVKNTQKIEDMARIVSNMREQLGNVSRRQQALDQQLRELAGQVEEAVAAAAKNSAGAQQAEILNAEILRAAEERNQITENMAAIQLSLSVRIEELAQIVPVPDEDGTYTEGVSYFQSGNYDAAQGNFDLLIKHHPNGRFYASAYYWLSQIYLLRGEYELATEASRFIIGLYGDNDKKPDAMLTLAQALAETGQREESRETLENLIAAHPTTFAADKARQLLAQ